MRLVVSALAFPWSDIGECLSGATGEFGLDGVELSWKESFQRPHCTAGDLAVLAADRSRRTAVLSAHIWNNLAQADAGRAGDELLAWLGFCERTGVRDLVVHGGSCEDRVSGIVRTRRVLESVLSAFERRHVTVNLENHYAYDYRGSRELFSEPWEFLEVLTIDSPSLRVCLDTGHAHMNGNTAERVGSLAPWLRYVHLADNLGVDDDHLAYGQGSVKWDEVFERLRGVSFDGVFCVEFPVREDKRPFQACLRAIRSRWPCTGPN